MARERLDEAEIVIYDEEIIFTSQSAILKITF